MRRGLISLALALFGLPSVAVGQEADAQDPMEELFAAKCGSCHSVGKGDRVGPDLKGVHERRDNAWLAQFIIDPGPMLNSDAEARAMLKKYNNVRMPGLGLDAEQAQGLIKLIERCSASPCNLAGKFTPVTKATDEDRARGKRLFRGVEPLAKGAPACMACHSVGGMSGVAGGKLAKDLTHTFARLGDEGLDAALKNPAFPVMNKIFEAAPLEKDEAFALRAYLDEVNRAEVKPDDTFSILLAGIFGTVLSLILLNAAWSRRLRGVRTNMPGRQGASS